MASHPTPPQKARQGRSIRWPGRAVPTLLEINNAIVANLTQEALFTPSPRPLRRVLPFDRTAIFPSRPQRDVLRLFVSSPP